MVSRELNRNQLLQRRPVLSLKEKRGLLKRSKAMSVDRPGGQFKRSSGPLQSLPEYESGGLCIPDLTEEEADEITAFPSLPDRLLKNIELYGLFDEGNKNLNEPDIEEKFARLSLAFRTDKSSLRKRLDLQLRQRDIAEDNIDSELKTLRESLNALNQLCTESDMRDIITKTQQHVDIVQQATKRMSSRAETYGAIQQEQRMNCAFETMLNYVEHLKLLYDKEHLELEEYRRLLAEHNLLPGEDKRPTLPPRSQSLSCSSKPALSRRGSLGTVFRAPSFDSDRLPCRGTAHYTGWNLSRQKLESRTRLLSAVCLLNNNNSSHEARPAPNGSLSPKSRRSSLPVGPLAQSPGSPSARALVNGRQMAVDRRESQVKSPAESQLARTESEESTSSKPEADSSCTLQEQPEEATDHADPPTVDCSELKTPNKPCSSTADQETASYSENSLQESVCDNDSDICLLPDIIVPVRSKPLFVLNWIRRASARRIWQWDNATLLLHARYTLSALLATAAMFTFVLTFVPSQVLGLTMK